MSRDVRVVARAKLTLSLRVLGVRPDGYHEIEGLVVSLREPHDVVGLRIQPPFGVRVRLSGRAVIGVPADETNLAARAARLLLEVAADGEDPGPWAASGLDLSLHKAIPAGAGLGGGSADAAGTLVGGARLLGLDLDAATLANLAARLGSDVPFCIAGGIAWMRGRGEIIEPLSLPSALTRTPAPPTPYAPAESPPGSSGSPGPFGSLWRPGPSGAVGVPAPPGPSRLPASLPPPGPSAGSPWPGDHDAGGLSLVVAVPPFGLATPTVYRAWDELGGPSSARPVPLPEGLAGLGLPDEMVNDLEPAAERVEPRLRPFREALEALAGAPALLAGSGSAYVVAVASAAQAAVVATQVGVELRAMAFATGLATRGVEAQKSPD
ncbi:MAG: 4-diphosphocytidyl-2-C-methyl-D-erythritol kinase [Actinomycetota bacterium]|nr:4-diphosphocytidyl-2-C-methyl-D-erythritol kinase [Actinomycetota bacterium]